MGNIVVMMSISLDGFIAAPGGDLSWHRVDDELHAHMNGLLAAMGGFLHGRVMYELMASVWPTADKDPASTPPMVEFSRIWLDMPKVVYSRTLDRAEWNTTIARDVVPEEVEELKARTDGDFVVGGAGIADAFRRRGLVDEYRIYVHPVLVGRGRQLFEGSDTLTDLELVESRTFGNGVALVRYATA